MQNDNFYIYQSDKINKACHVNQCTAEARGMITLSQSQPMCFHLPGRHNVSSIISSRVKDKVLDMRLQRPWGSIRPPLTGASQTTKEKRDVSFA